MRRAVPDGAQVLARIYLDAWRVAYHGPVPNSRAANRTTTARYNATVNGSAEAGKRHTSGFEAVEAVRKVTLGPAARGSQSEEDRRDSQHLRRTASQG